MTLIPQHHSTAPNGSPGENTVDDSPLPGASGDDCFVPLHVHSAYSLLEGAVTVKDLVGLAVDAGIPAMAVTDTNNLFGALEFATVCVENGIQPIIGCEIRVDCGPGVVKSDALDMSAPVPARVGEKDGVPRQIYPLVLLAQSDIGYQNLVALSSACFLENDDTNEPHVTLHHLRSHAAALICLTGGYGGPLNKLLGEEALGQRSDHRSHPQDVGYNHALGLADILKSIFGDGLYIELTRLGTPDQERIEADLLRIATQLEIPIVATNPVFFRDPGAHRAHDALLCVSAGTYVSVEDRRHLTPDFCFKSSREMHRLFADLPQAVKNTALIAQRCHFFPKSRSPILPAYISERGLTEEEELRRQAMEGLEDRLKRNVLKDDMTQAERDALRATYQQRLDYEIGVIIQMGFAGYFLIVSDFIKWAKGMGIPVGPGRGSGAGSATAWCLAITDMDPLRFHLIFERFLNPERVSMPDFDVDFCQERRDEVITYVQKKYGHDRVAQIITYGKLQARAVLRDVGRVLQIPYGQVDRICKLVPNNPANPLTLQEALTAEPKLAAERDADETVAELIDISLQLEGLYRHASTHAAGVVIADRPLQELVPLYRDPKSTMRVTQFNMKMVEQAGLVKFDFLGLKTLTVIRKASDIVRAHDPNFDIDTLSLEDAPTFQLLRRVETVGIFQLESAGMSDVVRQLQPEHFDELIALVALYRPGPMDDIPRYIACRHGREPVTYMHPDLEPILKDSYGVMVYQEQVMWIAREIAGYSLGEADLLRRAMGKKIKSEMDKQRKRFMDGATQRELSPATAQELFDKIAKFASYAFPKAHAAPYALLSYQTAYLKANHPLAFYAASLTLDIHNTDKITVFKQDMHALGYKLLLPDINASHGLFEVEGEGVRYALGAVKGVGVQAMEDVVAERTANGPFTSIWDFVERVPGKVLNKRQMEALIAAGAFDSLHGNRRQLYESCDLIMAYGHQARQAKLSQQGSLFDSIIDDATSEGTAGRHPPLPEVSPWSLLEKLDYEYNALGFYLSAHPLDAYNLALPLLPHIPLAKLADAAQQTQSEQIHMVVAVVLGRKDKVSRQGNRFSFVQVSDPSGNMEATAFSDVLRSYSDILEPGRAVYVKVQSRWDAAQEDLRFTILEVHDLATLCAEKLRHVDLDIQSMADLDKWQKALEPTDEDQGMRVVFNLTIPLAPGLDIQGFKVALRPPKRFKLKM